MTDGVVNEWLNLQRDPLQVARAAAGTGRKVIGYVGNDIPVALILAAGALPVRMRGITGAATAHADTFVESSFAAEHRSLVEQWLAGELDFLEAVVFPRSNDSAQRIYYYVCELQRRGRCAGPRALLFDAAGIARDSSREYTRESTRRLAAELGTHENRLAAGLQRVAGREALLRAVDARRLLPTPLAGSAAAALDYASHQDWREDFDARAEAWMNTAPQLPMPRRIVLAGDAAAGTEIQLALEAAGASVVLELFESRSISIAMAPVPKEQAGDFMTAIADAYHQRETPLLAMRRDARWVAKRAIDHRADGVVLWLNEQNEALPWEAARQMKNLRAAGIPALLLSRQPWRASAAALIELLNFVRQTGDAA